MKKVIIVRYIRKSIIILLINMINKSVLKIVEYRYIFIWI